MYQKARTEVPTKYANDTEVAPLYDALGRAVITQHHIREAHVTATASVSTGTKTTLLSGQAEYKLDLLYLTASNSSDAAYSVTLSDDGTNVYTFNVPASNTIELRPEGTILQSAAGGNWQLDIGDLTGGTITVFADFIKNK